MAFIDTMVMKENKDDEVQVMIGQFRISVGRGKRWGLIFHDRTTSTKYFATSNSPLNTTLKRRGKLGK